MKHNSLPPEHGRFAISAVVSALVRHPYLTKPPLIMAALGMMSAVPAMAADDDMQVNLDFRTFYMNRDFDQNIPDTIAAGQAFRVELLSPYWHDMIGVDVSAVHVAKLEGDKTENSSDVLTPEGEGYTTLEQAYLKLRPVDNVNVKVGRMILMTPLLNDLTSRLSAPSTQAIYGSATLGNGEVYALYSDRASMNNSEKFEQYRSASGETYDIKSLGTTYKFDNGLSTHLQYAVADDYQKQLYLNLSYPTRLGDHDLLLDLTHMRGEADGSLFADENYDSNLTGLTGRLSKGSWAYTLAYQTIGGRDDYRQQWGGGDNTQFFTWGAVQLLDFNARDEQSLQLRVDYDVPALPGLHLMARHTESWDIDYTGGDDGQRRETNIDAKYTLQDGAAKGLSLRLRVAQADGDEAVVPRINDIRLIAEYRTNLL
ncbi:imipenem/basic amino acid-specific outer membrane pore [Marinobacterium halophilum]|uniref:Imipenem/basic amino acid-specific outer membrane pore n=1 Tax=Marinobacterium halophilum TaxID=267374 RepID=A0A2P8ER09_9GAMM|nr:OprD family outer membrane porin [Marinobacterium halophilum]PSL11907.1 imipenem/basic amino acid-specific outer membrane pore [Marinobacterium halophilum]